MVSMLQLSSRESRFLRTLFFYLNISLRVLANNEKSCAINNNMDALIAPNCTALTEDDSAAMGRYEIINW